MPRKRKMLNVKSHLERIIDVCEYMLKEHAKNPDGDRVGHLYLPPLFYGEVNELRFFSQAILRKHASKKTRKDIYVEAK